MGCLAPSIERAQRAMVSLAKSSDDVLAEAVAGLNSRMREKLGRALALK
jgi:hypothetical protein